jgi:hypothetical protein
MNMNITLAPPAQVFLVSITIIVITAEADQ